MHHRLTPVSHKPFEKFLKHIGCHYVHQKGSHIKYRCRGLERPLIIPARELDPFIIKNNLRILGISTREYLDIIEKL